MSDIVVGVIALSVGALLCFRGYAATRAVLAALGALAGFGLGAGLVAVLTGRAPLDGVLGWVGALVGAIVLGSLAYAFYRVAVMLGMASIGFSVGAGAMLALGVQRSWLVLLVGAAVGLLLGVLTLVGNLPAGILVVLTALSGASLTLSGAMVLVGAASAKALLAGQAVPRSGPWWIAADVLLVGLGVAAQLKDLSRAPLREHWTRAAPATRGA
jgi:hypothetical protein